MGRGVVGKRMESWGECGEEGVMKGMRRRVGEGRLKVCGEGERRYGKGGRGRCWEEGVARKV